MLIDEAVDGGVELDDGVEHAAPEAPLGELGEEAFDGIQPGAAGTARSMALRKRMNSWWR